MDQPLAPPLDVLEWINVESPLTLASLRGRVVVLHAFQMLCPGCVLHGLPQSQRIAATFDPRDVAVIGLHSVFEHHEAMSPNALRAFLSEYRISFPVAIDQPTPPRGVPKTMQRYQLQGTPSLVLIDRAGRLRHTIFGRRPDLEAGALVASLAAETPSVTAMASVPEPPAAASDGACTSDRCSRAG